MNQRNKVVVLWVNGDAESAMAMALMYAKYSKVRGWWEEVELVVWGPSTKETLVNEEVKAAISELLDLGVEVTACLSCAERYGIADDLRALGIDVKRMGPVLTEYLKNDIKVLTI